MSDGEHDIVTLSTRISIFIHESSSGIFQGYYFISRIIQSDFGLTIGKFPIFIGHQWIRSRYSIGFTARISEFIAADIYTFTSRISEFYIFSEGVISCGIREERDYPDRGKYLCRDIYHEQNEYKKSPHTHKL